MKNKKLEAQLRYYSDKEEKIKERAKDKRGHKRRFIQDFKDNKPCADCGINYPWYIMQYDHVRGTKRGNLNRLYTNHSMEEILDEISKCDIVCANCHAHRTWMSFTGVKSGTP